MCLVQETASFNVLYRYLDDVLTTQRVVLILECTFIVSIYVYCCEVFVFSFDKLWQRKESTNGKIVVRTTYPFGFSNDFFAAPRFQGSLMISSLLPGFILSSGTLSCIYPRQIDGSSSRMLLSCSQQVSYKGSNRASSFSKFKDNIG